MRISDWSSDVCSSDLDRERRRRVDGEGGRGALHHRHFVGEVRGNELQGRGIERARQAGHVHPERGCGGGRAVETHPAGQLQARVVVDEPADGLAVVDGRDRKSVVWGKSGSLSVDLGGRRYIKKKKK